nr:hypothetical protein [Tanacetum cinerariifolium]
MPPKPYLVFNTAPLVVESDHSAINVQLSPAKPAQPMSHTTDSMAPIIEDWVSDSEDESEPDDPQSASSFVQSSEHVKLFRHSAQSVKAAPIIEDWVSDSEDEFEPNDSQSAPSFVQPSKHVKLSGHSAQPVEAPILDDTPKPTSSKTNGSRKGENRKTCFVCRGMDHLIKDYNFHTKPKSQPTPRNSAYRGYDKQYASSTKKYPQKHIVLDAVLTKSKPVSVTVARPVSVVVPKIMATKPRHTRSLHTNPNSIIKRHKTRSKFSKTSNSSPKVTVANAKIVSDAKGKKGK